MHDDICDLDPFVQLDVARSEHADPQDLAALASERGHETHHTLAEFGRLPAEAVELLARHEDEEVRVLLVRNQALAPGPAALREALLVDDPSAWVRSELLELDLSVPLRTRVLAGLPPEHLSHPQDWMPEELLGRVLVEAGHDEVLRAAAVRCLPGDSDLLLRLSCDPSADVRSDVASNPVLPLELARRLAADEDAFVRQCAVRPELGPTLLTTLAGDPDPGVRTAVARTCRELVELPSAGAATRARASSLLARLARDPDDDVRSELALHPPLHALLVEDGSEHVRRWVASTATDPSLLRRLAEQPDPELDVVPSVAGNGSTPPAVLRALLARLLEEWIEVSGLSVDEEPPEGSARWLGMRQAEALAHLVANPALPAELVPPLLVHRAPAVADAALRRLPGDPDVVPVRALRRRARRGLLWQLLVQRGVDVHDPAVRGTVLELLPGAEGTVADLAEAVLR